MTPPVIVLDGVSKRYRKRTALRDVDLEVFPSEITGIIGPDGAGKSSLLKICAAVLSFEGRATCRNLDLRRQGERVKQYLSFMPQGIGLNLYMDLSVDENIDFFASIKDVAERERELRKPRLLEMAGLTAFRDRLARHLSGGMKQKLGLCCALISDPEIILLDEPSTGVDPLSRRQLWEILDRSIVDRGATLVLSTSYLDEAERCHSTTFLHEGGVLYSGHPERLMEDGATLEDAFFDMLLKGQDLTDHEIPFPPSGLPASDNAVRVEGVFKNFGSFCALSDVTLSVRTGEIFGFLGPNGAGKTTLIKCMVGLLHPDRGTIALSGLKAGEAETKRKTGYMSQIFSLYADLTVMENIELYGSLYGIGRRDLQERKRWILDVSGLKSMEGMIVRSLPLGMKQRLALGCATLHLPSILFLDEPTSGVDPVARMQFWKFIRTLAATLHMTVIVTTHNLIEADQCDRVAIMNEGRIIALDSPQSLRGAFVSNSGRMLEIYPSGSFDVALLAELGASAVPYGRRYHVWKKDLSTEALRSYLDARNVGYRFIREIRPPMEDVFIYFLRKSAGA